MGLYIHPVLSDRDYGFFRIGGPGLANCMFFVARAVILAEKLRVPLIRPTWERIGIGQWIRKERDKRLYTALFRKSSFLQNIKKLWLLMTKKRIAEQDAFGVSDGVISVGGLNNYFADLWEHADVIREYFKDNILPSAIKEVPQSTGDVVAIHVRLGDYPNEYRTDLDWYIQCIEFVRGLGNGTCSTKFWLFSDGTDEELKMLLSIPGVKRVYFGNALADMIAMSRSRLIIGSDSTFSGWAAFLGNVPCVFAHLHYGRPIWDEHKVCVAEDVGDLQRSLCGIINRAV